MTNLLNRGIFALTLTLFANAIAKPVPSVNLAPLSPLQGNEIYSKLDLSLLPKGVSIDQPPSKQVFTLKAQGSPDLLVVPVLFWSEHIDPVTQCGVYFMQDKAASYYIQTIGLVELVGYVDCEKIKAVGVMTDPGPRPRLLFIFQGRAMAGNRDDYPFVLSWDENTMRYGLDKAVTNAIQENEPFPSTIAATRAVLARKYPKPR